MMQSLKQELIEFFSSIEMQLEAFKSRLKSEVYYREEEEKCLQHELSDYLDTVGSMDNEKFRFLVKEDCEKWESKLALAKQKVEDAQTELTVIMNTEKDHIKTELEDIPEV